MPPTFAGAFPGVELIKHGMKGKDRNIGLFMICQRSALRTDVAADGPPLLRLRFQRSGYKGESRGVIMCASRTIDHARQSHVTKTGSCKVRVRRCLIAGRFKSDRLH